LSGNFISTFDGVSNLSSLEEINFSNNKICQIKDTRGLISIKKINLASNLIESGLEKIRNLDKVIEFSIENNPIHRKAESFKSIKKMMPNLTVYNGRKAILPKELTGNRFFNYFR
jgi:hypothetical protein